YRAGGNGQPHQRPRRQAVAIVPPDDDLAFRRHHPGRRQRLIRLERVLALSNELLIHVLRAHDILKLLKSEIKDVISLTEHARLHETLRFLHQRLLVNEVSADLAVLRVFYVPGEGAHPVDHPLGLRGAGWSIGKRSQASEQLLLLLPRLLQPLIEAPRGGAGLEVLDVTDEDGE